MARNSSHGDSSSSGRGRRAAKTPAAAAAATTPAATPVSGASSSAPAKSSTDRPMAERLLSKAGTSSEYAKLKAQWAAAKALMDKEKQEQERKRRQLAASAGTGTTRAGSKASDVATAGAGAGGEAGDEDVTGQLATQSNLIQAINRRDPRVVRACEKEFGGWHAGIVGVLLWFLLIHLSGIYFFTKGFLLTRSVLDNKSTCEVLPFEGEGGDGHGIGVQTPFRGAGRSVQAGCWHPRSFTKAVVVVIDALRYDFVIPSSVQQSDLDALYHDKFPILYDTANTRPQNAFLRPFIADPPTTTLQRLKGLTTGTLPTFIDAGSNFAGMTIEEDNLVSQLQSAGKTVVHLGDDTWQALFPDSFNKMLSRPFDSFNVWDLHTVDDGVTAHLLPLLHPTNASSWDVIFAHYLGVDHAGHRYGPQHSAMAAKLKQMNTLIEDVMQRVDDETLLVVLGDHGMDAKGDHGGESDDEIQATLWMYAKKPAFGRVDYAAQPAPPASAADAAAAVPQIDLVPTLSLLLGLPIPFNNLGSPIDDAFAGSRVKKPNWQNLVDVNRITAAQIRRYQGHYADARGLDETHRLVAGTRATFDTAETAAAGMGRQTAAQRTAYQLYRDYERDVLRVCKSLWVTFDETSMRVGVALLAAALVVLFAYARAGSKGIATAGERTRISSEVLALASRGAGAGAVLGAAIAATGLLPIDIGVADAGVLGATALSITAASTRIFRFAIPRLRLPFPRSLWSLCAVLITLLPPLGFASNSYTIWEDRITLFLLTTFGVLAACSSLRQEKRADRILGFYHSCLFVVLGRVAAISRLCREEQMPFCKSTYYASASSSMSAAWQLAIPFIVALTLPAVIKSYYAGSASYEGSASFWLSVCFRFSLVLTAVTWVLDARDDSTAAGGSASAQAVGDMLASLDPEGSVLPSAKSLKRIRVTLAQLALGVGLVVGLTNYAWAKPCISVDSFRTGAEGKDEAGNSLVPSDAAAMLPPAAGGAAGDSAAAGAMPTAAPGTLYISILGWSNVYGTLYFFLVTAFALAIIQMQKPMGGGAIALQLWQVLSLLEILDTNGLTTSNNAIGPVVLGLLGSFHYFTTGHQATLSSIQWDAAFIPLRSVRYPWSPALIVLNTFGAQILSAVAVPLCVLWKRQLDARCLFGSSSADSDADDSSRGEQDEQQEQPAARVSAPARSSMLSILSDVAQAASTHILYHAVISLLTTLWAGHLRRHLMLYRIFSPRFMMGAAVTLVVDAVVALVAVAGVRWTMFSVGDTFTW